MKCSNMAYACLGRNCGTYSSIQWHNTKEFVSSTLLYHMTSSFDSYKLEVVDIVLCHISSNLNNNNSMFMHISSNVDTNTTICLTCATASYSIRVCLQRVLILVWCPLVSVGQRYPHCCIVSELVQHRISIQL